ncbi:hypothetical protein [Phycicoccus duodecadis]|uniref:hypothetical protein n=1 Tax=Phycicoccus duodecadis TaxID=173053 RepID=UPI000C708F69|nr:hypothetical protein [Phycicoccus duodecadis]
MARQWPPRPDPFISLLSVSLSGVFCAATTVWMVAGIRFTQPISLLPPVLMYAFMQGIFRLGVLQSGRRLRKRNLLFIP